MCGIVAAVAKDPMLTQIRKHELEIILDRMAYRGPDSRGAWSVPHVLMGHRRLSIIDLSDAGTQPFHDLAHNLHITFNGEIYNYRELRKDLEVCGYRFHSDTDTEVILGAYYIYGRNFLNKLRGMFAFILFDAEKKKVLLCRDRMGKKPLYYYFDGKELLSSSEIKFLHGFKGATLSIDPESLRAFFSLQYIPGPHTIYTEVRTVEPGECVELDMNTWQVTLNTYWSIHDQFCSLPASGHELESIDAALAESVRYRLIADVDIGILLSGGIDSSLLSCYAASQSASPPRAFLVSFDRSDLDESVFAKMVADSLGIDIIEIDGGKLDENIFTRVVYHADQPLGDPACIPTFMICEAVAQHVKVVLSGEGADELFWGYSYHRKEILLKRIIEFLPSLRMRRNLYPLLASLENSPHTSNSLSRISKMLAAKSTAGCALWTSVFGDAAIDQLMPGVKSEIVGGNLYLQQIEQRLTALKKQTGASEASIALDLAFWLPDDLLVKVDRMSMAHSVEARAPFLDHILVQQALNLPREYKVDLFNGKKILRKLLMQKLPAEIGRVIAVRKKHGFDVPLIDWLQNALRDHANNCFSPSAIRDTMMLDVPYVRSLWNSFGNGRSTVPFARKLWLLLCFMTWHEHHNNRFGFG